MALTPRLDLRQSQTLVMTPQLQQAIKLLQMSNLELNHYVEGEIEQNPLLETADGNEATDSPADDPQPPEEAVKGEVLGPTLDADYDNMWSSDSVGDGSGAAPSEPWRVATSAGGDSFLDLTPANGLGLRDHILQQIQFGDFDATDMVIASHLIDLLDEAGYLTDELTGIALALSCGVARIETTLTKLQRLDPPGLFARDLRECLMLQLIDRDRFDPAMDALLRNLNLVASGQLEELRRRCAVDTDDFAEMLAEIRALDPKPGLAFDSDVTQTIVPDVIVRQAGDGQWLVELNSDSLPRVLVNRRYFARVRTQAKNKGEHEYLVDRLNSANWLVKALDQRANTILRVAAELIRQQEAFLTHGIEHLRPLILRDIAEVVEMHESTISRVTANKFMSTPRGMFELRYFFSNAIANTASDGAPHSAEKVRQRVRVLIEGESLKTPLSDDRLVALLRDEGIEIARRTVAKYRESLHIPSSIDRRRRAR